MLQEADAYEDQPLLLLLLDKLLTSASDRGGRVVDAPRCKAPHGRSFAGQKASGFVTALADHLGRGSSGRPSQPALLSSQLQVSGKIFSMLCMD
jgi:hypothetical protein